MTPLIHALRRSRPLLWSSGHVMRVGDLLNFCRVLHHLAIGVQEVRKHIVPRTVPTHTPFYGIACQLHAAHAKHQIVPARHLKGDVIQAHAAKICQRQAVMVGIAAKKSHLQGRVTELKAQGVFQELCHALDILGVDDDMGEFDGLRGVSTLKCMILAI